MARIARQLAKPLSPGDIEWVVSEGMTADEWDRLCSAVDPEGYQALKKKEANLQHRLDLLPDAESKKLCEEYWRWFKSWTIAKLLAGFTSVSSPP